MFKKLLLLILCTSFFIFWNVYSAENTETNVVNRVQTQADKDAIAKSKAIVDEAVGKRNENEIDYNKSVEDAIKANEANKKKLNDTYYSDVKDAKAKLKENKDSIKFGNRIKELDSKFSKAEKDSDAWLVQTKKDLAKSYEDTKSSTEINISKVKSDSNQVLIDHWNPQEVKRWYEGQLNEAVKDQKKACAWWTSTKCTEAKKAKEAAETNYKSAKNEYDNSEAAKWDITSRWYQINVNDISPGMGVTWWTTEENVNFVLATIIQNLMIALWSFALLIMTIWAWYIILHNGQDELLSKWKSIFMSWVYALIIALSAYYLINIIRFILFQWN